MSYEEDRHLASASEELEELAIRVSSLPPLLDKTVQHVSGAVSGVQQAIDSDLAAQLEQVAEFTADNVKVNVEVLVDVLDCVSKIHPFIGVAALAFKAAVKLEMTRRKNDKRVLQLHADMCNMMRTVAWLHDFQREYVKGQETIVIEDRLKSRVEDIASDIEACAKSCAYFRDKVFIVRVLTGPQWEHILLDFSEKFDTHQKEVGRTLTMITASKSARSYEKLFNMEQQLNRVALFTSLRPREDHKLQEFIDVHGGPNAVWADEALRKDLERLVEENETNREDKLISHATNIFDEVGQDLQSTMQRLFNENQTSFDEHFQSRWDNLLATFRVALQEGNSEQSSRTELQDDDIRALWSDMRWGRREPADVVISQLLLVAAEKVHEQAMDRWALHYLSPKYWKQGLLEAIDVDGSGYVTIAEINSFSVLRPRGPEGWSLPRWMAYWTVGQELVLKHYYDAIDKQLVQIRDTATHALPFNRALVQKLLGGGIFYTCDCILAGVYLVAERRSLEPLVFAKFESRVSAEEDELRQLLESVNYELDSCIMSSVVGSRRLDTIVLPLLYLLLERALRIMKEAVNESLDQQQVLGLRASLWTLLRASYHRVEEIRDMFVTLSSDEILVKEKIKRVSLGLYRYIYCYDELGTSKYLNDQKALRPSCLTPGFSRTSLETQHSSLGSLERAWTYGEVEQLLTDTRHELYPFVQLCVEQGIMASEGEPADVFLNMAREAIAKAAHLGGPLAHVVNSQNPFLRFLTPSRTREMLMSSVTQIAKQAPAPQLQFCCALVDSVVRRQILHSPVTCDRCRKRTINMTRLICLTCSEDEDSTRRGRTTDYCARCLFDNLQLRCAVSEHDQHSFLQVRRFTYNKWRHASLKEARVIWQKQAVLCGLLDAPRTQLGVERHSRGPDERALSCQTCLELITSSFWFCLDCREERIYVCHECNVKDDKRINLLLLEDTFAERPITNRSPDQPTRDKHHWSHDLIFIMSPSIPGITMIPAHSRPPSPAYQIENSVGSTRRRNSSVRFSERKTYLPELPGYPIYDSALAATPALISRGSRPQSYPEVGLDQEPSYYSVLRARESAMHAGIAVSTSRLGSQSLDPRSMATASSPRYSTTGRHHSHGSSRPVIPEGGPPRYDMRPFRPAYSPNPEASPAALARSPPPRSHRTYMQPALQQAPPHPENFSGMGRQAEEPGFYIDARLRNIDARLHNMEASVAERVFMQSQSSSTPPPDRFAARHGSAPQASDGVVRYLLEVTEDLRRRVEAIEERPRDNVPIQIVVHQSPSGSTSGSDQPSTPPAVPILPPTPVISERSAQEIYTYSSEEPFAPIRRVSAEEFDSEAETSQDSESRASDESYEYVTRSLKTQNRPRYRYY